MKPEFGILPLVRLVTVNWNLVAAEFSKRVARSLRGEDRGQQAVLRSIGIANVEAGPEGRPWNSARRELACGS
jgi:hypothetical protein